MISAFGVEHDISKGDHPVRHGAARGAEIGGAVGTVGAAGGITSAMRQMKRHEPARFRKLIRPPHGKKFLAAGAGIAAAGVGAAGAGAGAVAGGAGVAGVRRIKARRNA